MSQRSLSFFGISMVSATVVPVSDIVISTIFGDAVSTEARASAKR
jgi:hypothetical protein